MPTEIALRIDVSGEVEQARLEELRRLLNLQRRGRLTDDEDNEFGYRNDILGDAMIRLSLSRASADAWSFWVSYDKATITPTDDLIDDYRDEILRTVEAAGLTFRHEYRRGTTPPRTVAEKPGIDPDGRSGMQAEHMVEALRRYVFRPGEDVQRSHVEPGRLRLLTTKRSTYEVARTNWLIGSAGWVLDQVRAELDSSLENFATTYGLILTRDNGILFLNEVATMRDLGSRIGGPKGADIAPLAYAELLAEFYSMDAIDGPIVYPFGANPGVRPGWLIRGPNEFRREYRIPTAPAVEAPRVDRVGAVTTIQFFSHNFYHVANATAIDIYRWTVTATAGQPATWVRDKVAERLIVPLGRTETRILPPARTAHEAKLYLGMHPCERCGDINVAWETSFVDDGGVGAHRYHGQCATCATAREFIFALPDHPAQPRDLDIYQQVVDFGGREPSQLLDPGEWLLVASSCASASDVPPGTPAQSAAFQEAQESLTMAVVAMGEVLKFVPPTGEHIPASAFWTARGRAERERSPDRFRRRRLLIIRDSYEGSLARMSGSM